MGKKTPDPYALPTDPYALPTDPYALPTDPYALPTAAVTVRTECDWCGHVSDGADPYAPPTDPNTDPYKLLTRADVAERLHCNVAHVSYLTKSGQLSSIRVGKRILVPLAVLQAFIRGEKVCTSSGWPPTAPLF